MTPCDHAVVFVSDPAFLLPSLTAANQVKRQADPARLADIFIVLVGFDDAGAADAARIVEADGFEARRLDAVQLPPNVHFNPTHVPVSAMARFFITSVIPSHYANIIYLDGDVQIVGDITPLLRHVVRDGFIAAANDKCWLGRFGRWRSQGDYLRGLGVAAADYFNSGVLAFRRQTWDEMGPAAFRFFCAHSGACRFHDQSALNAVFKGRREVLPPTYNYITDYVLIGRDAAEARIIHFTGGLKPWYYFGTPWGDRFKASYTATAARHPGAAAIAATKSARQQQAMQRAHTKRMALRTLAFPPLAALRRARFARYLKSRLFRLAP